MQTHFEAMESSKKWDPEAKDDNGSEEEAKSERTTPVDEALKVILLRSMLSSSSIPKLDLSTYDGNLIVYNLMDGSVN